MSLISSQNTLKADRMIRGHFEDSDIAKAHQDSPFDTFFEHGQWWVTCLACGAQWGACDSSDGFDFEQVTEGEAEEVHS